jgi:hypothetical protein
MTYLDNTNLYVAEMKGTTLVSESSYDYESVQLTPGLKISIYLTPDNGLEIENDITDWFEESK